MEFLVEIQVNIPPEMPEDQRAAILEQEAARGRELKASGAIVRMWRVPGRRANVGIWETATVDDLHAAITSLPAFPWLDVRVTALATHYLEARGEVV